MDTLNGTIFPFFNLDTEVIIGFPTVAQTNDRIIAFEAYDPITDSATVYSLWHQSVANWNTPVGSPTFWRANGRHSTIYRSGPLTGPSYADLRSEGTYAPAELRVGEEITFNLQVTNSG